MRRDRALALLSECTGDDIWSPEHCRLRGIPETWIDELAEAYESGFRSDRETIYQGNRVTNQYHGIRDVYLAIKLGEVLGVDARGIERQHGRPSRLVAAIKDAVFEG